MLAPARITPDVRAALASALARALAAPEAPEVPEVPEVQARIRALGGEPFAGGADAAGRFLADQQALWARIVQQRQIRVD